MVIWYCDYSKGPIMTITSNITSANTFEYFSKRPVVEVIPYENTDRMMESVEKFGPKFWGLDLTGGLYDSTADIPNRLIQFKKVLRTAPSIDGTTYEWTKTSAAELIKEAEKIKKRKIVLQHSKQGAKLNRPKISTTVGESLHIPALLIETTTAMQKDNDPIAFTISAFESWRLSEASHAPTLQYLRLGIATYEIALLSMRPDRTRELLGEIAVSKHMVVDNACTHVRIE